MKPIDLVLGRLEGTRRSGDGYKAHCPHPGHGNGNGDRHQSLEIKEGSDGRVLMHCFADCDTRGVVEAIGLKMSDLFPASNGYKRPHENPSALWEIKDAHGMTQAEHVHFDRGNGDKDCYWRLPGADKWGLKGRKLKTLPHYGSERAPQWPEDAPFVVVAEGEPATDALLAAHFPAVGSRAAKSPGPGG